MDVQEPNIWSAWKIIKNIIGERNLEVGPGNYPTIPIKNGYFLDISETAVSNLIKTGAQASLGSVERIDFPSNFFDSVVVLDVLEHVDDDKNAFSEIARVLKPDGFFLFSVPLGKEKFSEIDKVAGHKRRYTISELTVLISKNGLELMKWRAPGLKYWYVGFLGKLPFFRKMLVRIYSNKKSFRFFGLPKFIVNSLVRLTALIDRASAPKWEKDTKAIENFKGESVMLLCRKK